MELLQLRYFLTVAKTLNISHAAKHHFIPQSAMSKTISRLEKELGRDLFDRYKNKLTLTDEGKAFYHAINESLGLLDRAVHEISRGDAPLGGELKILVRQHRENVVNCMASFKKQYPNVSFRIFYEPDVSEDYDLCIAGQPPSEEFSCGTQLITERLVLVTCAEHPYAKETGIRFENLAKEEFAVASRDSYLWRQTVLCCQQAGFEPQISITCGDLHCLLKYVEAGMAVTIGPEKAWSSLYGTDVAVIPTIPEVFRSTYVFRNGQKPLSRLCGTYLEFLTNYFALLERGKEEI
ncbi:MAG: LysR family transcriptional regulator [Oscillospiraceae bacterium]|nr:LysR family transcriptional regulator [Oscillospiraceae bacterium]